ncbi:MAG: diguanylate cyclase [Desulfobulbaceae bacterium]|nr:diguanylate cyclase [Desulfobulbaceae bacterium]
MKTDIVELFDRYAHDEDEFFLAFEDLLSQKGLRVYPALFDVFADLDLPPKTAEHHWHEVVSHHHAMQKALNRKVCIRTSLFDYCCCIKKTVRNPKIIEIQSYEKTSRQAKFDELTGLVNRHIYTEALAREITRSERHALDLSILFFDMDNFKGVNDCYGHSGGDEVLKAVAGVILGNIRHEDIAVRYGGEEIIVLLPETSKKNALLLGERIRKDIEALRVNSQDKEIRVTVSGGLAAYPYDTTDPTNIQKNADQALLAAKRRGKNNICLFSQDMRRYVRINFKHEINVEELGFTGLGACKVTSKDISGGGFAFTGTRQFPKGSRIQTSLPLTSTDHLLLTARVKRSKPLEATGLFEIGASFDDLDNNNHRQLFSFIFQRIHGQQACL